jgi:hypothetical protein
LNDADYQVYVFETDSYTGTRLEDLIETSQSNALAQNKTMVNAEDYDILFTPHIQNFTMY